ncbi:hypothetical protein ACH4TQ_46705 [Streptomyces sp. NPDC021218]|uniref:hypothetical protein n=1 Tax=Streptomyces sp. NPDC021218 TaxID=3365119 RepID=UPI0037952228
MAAIVRSETYYRRPPTSTQAKWDDATWPERALIALEYALHKRIPRPAGDNGLTVWARIDYGRWLAECPQCSSAQVVTWSDPRMTCSRCFAGWTALTMPADPEAVEAPLVDLPAPEQFWWADDDPANPANQQPVDPGPADPEGEA